MNKTRKNLSKTIFSILRYIIMSLTLVYVIYGYVFIPLLDKLMPSLNELCPQSVIDFTQQFLIANKASIGFDNYNSLFMALFLLVFTFVFNRAFCAFICPMGTLQEFFGKFGKLIRTKVFKCDKQIRFPITVDRILRSLKYVFFGCSILFAWYIGIYFVNITFFDVSLNQIVNPWIAVEFLYKPAFMFEVALVAFISLIIFLIASLFIERFYCRYICPAGAFYSLISKISLIRLRRRVPEGCSGKCAECGLCNNILDEKPAADSELEETTNNLATAECELIDEQEKSICEYRSDDKSTNTDLNEICQMSINIEENNRMKSGECIYCMQCIGSSNQPKEYYPTLFKLKINPILYLILAIVIFFGGMVGARALEIDQSKLSTKYCVSDVVDNLNKSYEAAGQTPISVNDFLASSETQDLATGDTPYVEYIDILENIPFDQTIKRIVSEKYVKQVIKAYKLPKDIDLSLPWRTVMMEADATSVAAAEFGDFFFLSGGMTLEAVIEQLVPDSDIKATKNMKYGELLPLLENKIKSQYESDNVFKDVFRPCCIFENTK